MSAIFGYGSLCFKPPPYPLPSEPGYITGHVRRFAQLSHDHRGTEEHPGRVVTLNTKEDWEPHRKDEPQDSGHIWGLVYRIPQEIAEEFWEYIDHREKDGYTKKVITVYGVDNDGNHTIVEKECHVYVGETDNPSFGGGLPMQELAKWIARSKGPSGANKDYLYKMNEAIKSISPEPDRYLEELERLVREVDNLSDDDNRRGRDSVE